MLTRPTLMLQSLASTADLALNSGQKPPRFGFVILAFPFNRPDQTTVDYVSNGSREDVLAALKGIVARFEGQPRTRGRA